MSWNKFQTIQNQIKWIVEQLQCLKEQGCLCYAFETNLIYNEETGELSSTFVDDSTRTVALNIPRNTSDLVNDGENGTDPFITANDIPTPTTPGLQEVTDVGNTTTNSVVVNQLITSTSVLSGSFLRAEQNLIVKPTSGISGNLNYGSFGMLIGNRWYFQKLSDGAPPYYSAILNINGLNENREYILQDKPGTIAHLDDIGTPTLQSVLDNGKYASSPDGNSYIDMNFVDDNGWFDVFMQDDVGQTSSYMQVTNDNIYLQAEDFGAGTGGVVQAYTGGWFLQKKDSSLSRTTFRGGPTVGINHVYLSMPSTATGTNTWHLPLTINGYQADNQGNITLPTPTGLEAIDEGNGIGHRLIGRDPNNYGNTGLRSVDLSWSGMAGNTVHGATGDYSGALSGSNITAAGLSSIVAGGNNNDALERFSSVLGGENGIAHAYNSSVLGGKEMQAFSYGETVAGVFGTIYAPSSITSFIPTDRLLNIGNGTALGSRSDAFTILKNGLATLPSVTNTLIDTSGTGKEVITKEYGDAYYDNSGLTLQDVTDNGFITTNGLRVRNSSNSNDYAEILGGTTPRFRFSKDGVGYFIIGPDANNDFDIATPIGNGSGTSFSKLKLFSVDNRDLGGDPQAHVATFNGRVKVQPAQEVDDVLTLEYKRFGVFDYNDAATTVTPINITGGAGYVFLTNDELGVNTNKLYPPTGVTDVWDASLNQFDFTELSLGSTVHYRLDIEVTTTVPNQEVQIAIELGIGAAPYTLTVKRDEYKTVKTYPLIADGFVYMGDNNTRNNPAKFKIQSDGNATVVVNGWACNVQVY